MREDLDLAAVEGGQVLMTCSSFDGSNFRRTGTSAVARTGFDQSGLKRLAPVLHVANRMLRGFDGCIDMPNGTIAQALHHWIIFFARHIVVRLV